MSSFALATAVTGSHFHSSTNGILNAWLSGRTLWAGPFSGLNYLVFGGGSMGIAHLEGNASSIFACLRDDEGFEI
jgi:hypothetical protein